MHVRAEQQLHSYVMLMVDRSLLHVQVLLSVCSLLTDPNPADPLVGSIAQQLLADKEVHDKTAAEWTRRYAQG